MRRRESKPEREQEQGIKKIEEFNLTYFIIFDFRINYLCLSFSFSRLSHSLHPSALGGIAAWRETLLFLFYSLPSSDFLTKFRNASSKEARSRRASSISAPDWTIKRMMGASEQSSVSCSVNRLSS